MRLIDGAEAIRGDLPSSSTVLIDVPPGAGSSLGTEVHRLSAIQLVRDVLLAALQDATPVPVTIGGDCGVELAAVQHAAARGDVAVVWMDAHADLNTPQSSPSGSFTGMVLRTLLGDGPAEVRTPSPLRSDRVILAGVRALDDAESDFIEAAGVRHILPADLTAESLAAAVTATGASSLYIHIDLDVIDPSEFACVGAPEPFGIGFAALLDMIRAAREAVPLSGAGITGFAPASTEAAADDLPSILRIVGALTRKL